jgi:hypothetical protein
MDLSRAVRMLNVWLVTPGANVNVPLAAV